MANKKYNLVELGYARTHWQEPIPGSYDSSAYTKYLLKKQAVDLYIDGVRVEQIEKTTGIRTSRICMLIEECLKPAENGNVLVLAPSLHDL